jgi:transcriptional regulator with XRE-family HTH domain
MPNTGLLKRAIDESGFKQHYIAKRLGISHYALINKLKNKTEFLVSEVQLLCDLLAIDNSYRGAIFFDDA